MEGIREEATGLVWMALGIAVADIWVAVLLVSVFAPDFVTGTDPTRLPFGAMLSPIAGLVLTGLVCTVVRAVFQRPQSARAEATVVGIRTAPTLTHQAAAHDAGAKLRQLPELRDAGAITEGEFESKKRKLLTRM